MRKKRFLSITLGLLTVFSFMVLGDNGEISVKASGGGWDTSTLDYYDVGSWSSITLDSDGNPHISYLDKSHGDLIYTERKPGGGIFGFDPYWLTETVDSEGNVGDFSSIGIDSDGNIHIGYQDSGNWDLKYARRDGSQYSTWNIETVDAAGKVGGYLSMALDIRGYPHISYFDYTNEDLKYASWDGGAWHIETVDSSGNVGEFTSLTLDINGYPHISYSASNGLKYARWDGSAWSIEMVDDGDPSEVEEYFWDTSIALDSNDLPNISYYDANNMDLKYAKWTGSEWNIETVDSEGNVGEFSSIALYNDEPYISYRDKSNHNLKLARRDGSGWRTRSLLHPTISGSHNSMALDGSGHPHLSFYDDLDKKVRYYEGVYGGVSIVGYGGLTGRDTSIAADNSGHLHISYYDYTKQHLKYAYWDGDGWSIETVDTEVAGIGYHHRGSIAVDSNGYPGISYYHTGTGKGTLKFAKRTSSGWTTQFVDYYPTTGYVGSYSSLAFDSSNFPHISYHDSTGGALKYAKFVWLGDLFGGTWVIETVEDFVRTGLHTELALDSNGYPRIAYVREPDSFGSRSIWFAEWTGSTWNISKAVNFSGKYQDISLVLDSDNLPHIAYTNIQYLSDDLRYARQIDGEWFNDSIERIGGEGLITKFVSIAIDSEDIPHVSFYDSGYDSGYGSIMHAKLVRIRENPFVSYWAIQFVDSFLDSGGFTSIAIDSNDIPHISYHSNGNLKYATLAKNQPPLAEAGGPYVGSEGGIINFNASGSSDPDGDALQYRWDFDNDGTWDTGYNTDPTAMHVWVDDYSGVVRVEVFDDEYTDIDTAVVTVNNITPVISGTPDQESIEGVCELSNGTSCVSSPILFIAGIVSDPGTDSIEYRWDWESDGTYDTDWSSSDTAFHQWFDDYTGTVTVQIRDDDGGMSTDTCTVTVNNAPPIGRIDESYSGEEGSPITFTALGLEAGSDDTTFTWDWGDGSPPVISVYYNNNTGPDPYPSPDPREIDPSIVDVVDHTYRDDGEYLLTLTIADDDGGAVTYTANVVVNNVTPAIEAFGPYMVNEGFPVTLSATATDQGTDDLIFRWELEPEPALIFIRVYSNSEGVYPFSATDSIENTYGDNGLLNITLTVEDGDGGSATYRTTIAVDNVVPTVSIDSVIQPFPDFILPGDELSFVGSFYDPGSGDTHTLLWDFGDGTTATGTLSPSHPYSDAGTYSVRLTVTDDDGGVGSASVTIVVERPEEATGGIVQDIEEMNLDGGLENSLLKKLESAITKIKRGQNDSAVNQLEAFIQQVEAQRGTRLTDEEADALILAAKWIIDNVSHGGS